MTSGRVLREVSEVHIERQQHSAFGTNDFGDPRICLSLKVLIADCRNIVAQTGQDFLQPWREALVQLHPHLSKLDLSDAVSRDLRCIGNRRENILVGKLRKVTAYRFGRHAGSQAIQDDRDLDSRAADTRSPSANGRVSNHSLKLFRSSHSFAAPCIRIAS